MTDLKTTAESTATPTHALRRARLSVALTFGFAGIYFAAWVPRIPEIKDRIDVGPGLFGVALLAPAIGALLAMSFAGHVATRFGTARATTGFATAFLLVGWAPGLAQNLVTLWVLLFVAGIGMGGMDVSMNAQAVSVEKLYERPVMSGFHAAWSLASLLGAAIGTVGAGLHIPVPAQQAGLAALLLLALVPVSRGFVPDPAADASAESEATTANQASRGPRRVFDLSLVLLGLAGMAAMLSEGSVGDWSGVLLRDSLHASAGQVGLGFAAFMATQTLGRLVGDRFVHRVGRIHAIVTVTAIGSVGLAVGLATGTTVGVVAGFAMLGIGLSIMVPICISAAADGRREAGPAIAAVSSMSYTGFLAGPTAIGVVGQATSISTALWLVPIITAAGGTAAVIGIRRRSR